VTPFCFAYFMQTHCFAYKTSTQHVNKPQTTQRAAQKQIETILYLKQTLEALPLLRRTTQQCRSSQLLSASRCCTVLISRLLSCFAAD
jgi:hypothetical protein